ncbi:MAG: sigma-70 family RNA polymerase sigma factor [Candidatus Aminicenantes bacterium]|nr:sigma-70 family RNA polymerase sigma factor [Candidatus Aminicenantes bacterium]
MNDLENAAMTDESTIILLAKQGHPQAFRDLYDLHFETIYRTAYRYTRSAQDAEDVMQETFTSAFRHIRRFDFERNASFNAWLGRICVNCSINHLRKRRARRGSLTDSLTSFAQDLPSGDPSPEETALSRRMASLIEEALHRLPPRQQLAFRMKYVDDLIVEEIAGRMDCSPNTVKTNLARALAVLRRRLKPHWSEP